jgi:hypothetical protein
MRVLSGLLAQTYQTRNRHAAALARALRAAGVRSLVVPKQTVARALAAQRKRPRVPRAVVDRLLRKRLVVRAAEVRATVRAEARRRRAGRIDVLASLRRPIRTAQLRAAADAVGLADVARLLEGVEEARKAPAALRATTAAHLAAALRCDPQTLSELEALAAAVVAPAGLGREGGLLVATAARSITADDLRSDPVCA